MAIQKRSKGHADTACSKKCSVVGSLEKLCCKTSPYTESITWFQVFYLLSTYKHHHNWKDLASSIWKGLLCLCHYIAIRINNCSKSTSVITVATHCRLGKLRLVFRWFYFVGHTYVLVVPTMNHYYGSWYTYENTLVEHKLLWFNWRKGVRIMEDQCI